MSAAIIQVSHYITWNRTPVEGLLIVDATTAPLLRRGHLIVNHCSGINTDVRG